MKRTVLVITESDPRKSGRTAEAVRIAAGLSTHEQLAVTLCLKGSAREVFQTSPEDLVDGDHLKDYLPVLAESGTIGIVGGPTEARNENFGSLKLERLSEEELEKRISSSDRAIRF